MTGGAADVFAQHDGREGVAADRGEYSTVTDTRLGDLVATSRDVREASRRLDKVGRLAAFLRQLGAEEIESAVAFLCGALPQGRIGVGFSALSEVRSVPAVSAPGLTLAAVDSAFEQVAATRGRGSTAARVQQLRDLLARATRDEQDFLLRLLYGEIRQGALESVITDAVARAAGLPAARVRRAVMMAGGLGPVARVALGETDSDLSQFSLRVFHPVQPMLAQSADGADDALARLGAMALDYKLDGARVQVHKDGPEVRVFTRHLREVTAAVPEVVETVGAMPPRRLILDGEVLALGSAGTPLPFQVTMRRFGRKLDVDALRRTLPLTPFFFDCLLVDGQDLIDEPFSRRADALAELAGGRWLVRRVLSPGAGEAAAFVDEARRAG
ncbi:MAG: ATP-dependent DNA ligase, partial [Acidobacteria bacterium]|nr:ATP-dependent DNA ligase [Acidobacteriota bacterium]